MEYLPYQSNNPPVQEAIFSIAFQEAIPIESIRSFSQSEWISAKYPEVTPLNDSEDERLGLVFTSTNNNSSLRFSTTQFNFHIVNGYPGWDLAIQSFLEAWRIAENQLQLPTPRYASLRYINKLSLGVVPEDGLQISSYLRLVPDLPDNFPGEPGRFFLQVDSYNKDDKLLATIWETLLPPKKDEPIYVLLDIRVRSEMNREATFDLQNFLQKGRIFKNSLFESCITPAMQGLLK